MVQQQQDANVEWQSKISQLRGTVGTDNKGGTRIRRNERLRGSSQTEKSVRQSGNI